MTVKPILKQIAPYDVTLVAASKYVDASQMRALYKQGITHFGENRVSALLEKKQALQDLDITWHFIGTLQTKKIKKVANEIDYCHSIHKLKTAKELNKRLDHPLKCLLQVNISDESTKHGFLPSDVIPALKEIQLLKHIDIIGLMGMASHTSDVSLIDAQFQIINDLEQEIKQTLGLTVNQHSIGMSNDYLIALKHNARFIRLGSVLFKKEV